MSEMKNILFIQPSSLVGGSSNALFDILQALDKTQYRPIVYCREDGPIVKNIERLGIKVYRQKF